MGQRLNIEILMENEESYSNCYYHWSAYTQSTIEQVKDIIENYKKIKATNIKYDNLLLAYKLLNIEESTIDYDNSDKTSIKWIQVPAGLSKQSYDMMHELYPNETFDMGLDRNVGLIGIHPDDVISTRQWEEGRAYIDIVNEYIWFNVFWEETNVDTTLSDEEFYDRYCMTLEEYKNLPTIPEEYDSIYEYFNYDDMTIPFDDIDTLLKVINDHDRYKTEMGFIEWVR